MKNQNLPARIYRRLSYMLFPGLLGAWLTKIAHPIKKKFVCPLCNYHGPFRDDSPSSGGRTPHSHCPRCGSNVRMRLQYLVVERLRKRFRLSEFTVYHFSPEKAMSIYFKNIFGGYLSAGISDEPVDCPADLTALPFADGSCDFIFASHVLEHIQNDKKAITEIERVLRRGGIAVLPVPIVQQNTVEYPEPNPNETDHVRAPGLDYFDKYQKVFSKVEVFRSEDFDPQFQLWNYEDRTTFPTKDSPLKRAMPGERHPDFVPVCFA